MTHTVPSTGFLVGTPAAEPSSFVAYFGDIGPDAGESMQDVKEQVARLFKPHCSALGGGARTRAKRGA